MAASVFASDLGWFTINDYHIDMNLQTNGSMNINEYITVNFTEQRHGIFRELPVYRSDGTTISISDPQVIGDTLKSITNDNKYLTLKIGDANRTLIGDKTYHISYTIDNAITQESGRDELYRNIIWTERNSTIQQSSRTLHLPNTYTGSTGSSFAVWGANWQTGSDGIVFQSTSPTTRQWSLQHILQANEWITIGLKFLTGYFTLPDNYQSLFTESPQSNYQTTTRSKNSLIQIVQRLFIIPLMLFVKTWWNKIFKGKTSSYRPSKQPIVPQYTPPTDIEIPLAFYLRYYSITEPKIFTSLLYYRAGKGRATVKKIENTGILSWFTKDAYHITETSNNPAGATSLDNVLLQKFFGIHDTMLDDVELGSQSYSDIKSVIEKLQSQFDASPYIKSKEGILWRFGSKELTESGQQVLEHLRWYKEYLSKVEQPVLEQELRTNPDFINILLPWATLFGLESRLLKMVEEALKNINWYQSYDHTVLSYHAFSSMNSSLRSYSTPPRSSHSSWFWGGGWFSWGGGWWGGGGSR